MHCTVNSIKIIATLLIAIQTSILKGQTDSLRQPLNIAPAVSGSFGEIRNNHFHSGLDFRTKGKIGYRVYSAEAGFVSRIKVSPIGFGKAVYIEHPNGLTTVYAHLDRFSDKIAAIVEKEQYTRKSFEVEIFPSKNEIIVAQGEVIAFSGNSGSSGGPHLHYEVRETKTQAPLSPLSYLPNWKESDRWAPSVKGLYLYTIDSTDLLTGNLSRKKIAVNKSNGAYLVPDTIKATGRLGFGVETFDFINEASSRCGVASIALYVNNEQWYHLRLDTFEFAETKFVNSTIDYSSKINSNLEIVKLWIDENNQFSGLKSDRSKGILDIAPGLTYNYTIEIKDHSGNTTRINGAIKGSGNSIERSTQPIDKNSILTWNSKHYISTDLYDILIPQNALYHNIQFNHSGNWIDSSTLSIRISKPEIPIHKKFTLRVKQLSIPKELQSKAFIGYVNGNGTEYCASQWINGNLEATCSKFGNYTILIDTVPPCIKPKNLNDKSRIAGHNNIQFHINDNIAGISTYTGHIDNKWVLFEWDPKTKTLSHPLSDKITESGKWHNLCIRVTDRLNNVSEYKCEFFW